jgi:hypothetical protein
LAYRPPWLKGAQSAAARALLGILRQFRIAGQTKQARLEEFE